jgi:hypothetical protein
LRHPRQQHCCDPRRDELEPVSTGNEPFASAGLSRSAIFSAHASAPVDVANAASAPWAPRRDLLNEPCIGIRVSEGKERTVAGVRRIGAGNPRLWRERRSVPNVARTDTTAGDFGMCCFDVRDNKSCHRRARRRGSYAFTERDRASRPRRRELDDANVLCRGDILIQPPTQSLIELFGSLDIGHGDDVHLEVHGNFRYAGI